MATTNFFSCKVELVPPHYNFPGLSLQYLAVTATQNIKFKPLGLQWFKFLGSFSLRLISLKGRRGTTITAKAIQLH